MTQNNTLFELINSLNKSEKRYFKLSASLQKGSKLYLDLFNAVDKQKVYNEKKLLPILNNNKGKLAFNKNYLQKMIFRSLEAYHSVNSVDANLQRLIIRCKILFNKSLYKQYFATIKKAKLYALKYERFGYYIEILEMEKMFTKKQELIADPEDTLSDEAEMILKKLKNSFEYTRLIRKLFVIYKSTGTSRYEGHEELVNSVSSNRLLSNINFAESQKAKITFYRIQEIINKIKAEHESSIETAEKLINIIDKNPYPSEDFIVDFKADALLSVISASINSGRIKKAEETINKLKAIKAASHSDTVNNDIGISYYELEIQIKKEITADIKSSIKHLEELLKSYHDKIELDQELMIHFKLICAYITIEDFPNALQRANLLLSHPLLVTRRDIESFTRILLLIIHYEMKNYSLLPYLIRSGYHFLIRSEKLFKLESIVISFLRKLPGVTNDDELNYQFISLHKEMQKLAQNNFEKNAFEYFNFLRWVEKKIIFKK